MSLLGIDVGTTGCKAAVFSAAGELLGSAYREYGWSVPLPGQAVLDSAAVWGRIREAIREAVASAAAAAAASPPTRSRRSAPPRWGRPWFPSPATGASWAPPCSTSTSAGRSTWSGCGAACAAERLFELNGNTLGNHYGLTKLMWLRDHEPGLYGRADLFLNWAGLVAFLLGGEPAVDHSLANRSLLFDIGRADWSEELLRWSGLERDRLPRPVPSGTVLGEVEPRLAGELGLPRGTAVVSGAHDQCANAVGCGVTAEGSALFGMGTYLCIVPVYRRRPEPGRLMERGLNIEHHALPDRWVSFLYNMSGSLVKWFRDTFAAEEHRQARARGEDVYDRAVRRAAPGPAGVDVLPHFFSPMGPPDYISGSSGVLAGLRLGTTRGEILKGLLQGALFSLKDCTALLPGAGIDIRDYRAAGGGARSAAWVQLAADVLGKPFAVPRVTEAGALGAAIMAGAATGVFRDMEEGARAMVRLERRFEPDPRAVGGLEERYGRYRRLWPLLKELPAGTVVGGLPGFIHNDLICGYPVRVVQTSRPSSDSAGVGHLFRRNQQ